MNRSLDHQPPLAEPSATEPAAADIASPADAELPGGSTADPGTSDPGASCEADSAPLLPEEEWANALTHAAAAVVWTLGAVVMFRGAAEQTLMTTLCCLVFVFSAVSVFTASALSHHWIHDSQLLRRLRAWDQGLIYVMISGTYTPLVWKFAHEAIRTPLLIGIWVAAAVGFHSKVIAEHRVNGIGTLTYLLLGWVPALGLATRVPGEVLFWMAAGGVIYTLGVVVLLNDWRVKYFHALWHLCVVTAASCHFWAIYRFVARG